MAQMIQVPNLTNHTVIQSTLEKVKIDPTTDFALLYYLRIVIYVIIAIKLIEIVFMRRRKLKISERIQRKFLFSHGLEMIKGFSAEQHQLMNLTLQNTLKNAIQPLANNIKKAPSKIRKSVSFVPQSNTYYDPPESKSLIIVQSKTLDQQLFKKDQDDSAIQKKMQQQALPLIIEEHSS